MTWNRWIRHDPRRLGASLPIHRHLWAFRFVALTLILLVGAWSLLSARSTFSPGGDRLSAEQAETLVSQRLERVDVGHWVPGPPLAATATPSWMPAPLPHLSRSPHPRQAPIEGAALELSEGAFRDAEQEDWSRAAARFDRAATRQRTWQTLFNSGIALLQLGDDEAAFAALAEANEQLNALRQSGASGAEHFALRIATRTAAGTAALRAGDCLSSITQSRLAVRALSDYVEAEGALVHDRLWPFTVAEVELDNHSVWGGLAEAYAACDANYPHEYSREYREQSFSSEYDANDLETEEVLQGPFPEGLAGCIESAPQPKSTCWAYSNVNKVLWASRTHLAAGSQVRNLETPEIGSLARLTYNAAWLAATSEAAADRASAGSWLERASQLERASAVAGLALRIAELGRHLAPLTGDHSALAAPWRRTVTTPFPLAAELDAEDLKGIAWALSELWRDQLAQGRPGAFFAATAEQIRQSGTHGESLKEWVRQARNTTQDALAEEIRLQYVNDNRAAALAIRDFRADWLGESWPSRAAAAWRTPTMVMSWLGRLLTVLAVAAFLWLIERIVVVPYLTTTVDAYRREYEARLSGRRR